MLKLCPLSLVALLSSALCASAITPAERLAGGSASEDDPNYYDKNYYLDENDAFAPPSRGDSDLGEQVILQSQQKVAPFSVRANTFLSWSDNIASASTGEQEGWLYGGSLSVRKKQRLALSDWFVDAYAYQDAYEYDVAGLDFQATELGLGLIHNLSALDDLTLFGRYELLYINSDNPFLGPLNPGKHVSSTFHRVRFGAYKALLKKPKHVVTLSADAMWDFEADSGSRRQGQVAGRMSYTTRLTGKLRATTFYRVAWRDYISSPREDLGHYLGFELNYALNNWAELYASILYSDNDSNTASGVNDYRSLQTGVGVGFRGSF